VVAEFEGSIVGYASAWNVAGEIQLNRIAVAGTFRRSGIGTLLMNGIIERLQRWKPRKILLEVRERNTAARAFYKSIGFYETGRRNNYYHDDNAILLDLDLTCWER
jgi:ribosomal-protein-alanine N-acetyltransferase